MFGKDIFLVKKVLGFLLEKNCGEIFIMINIFFKLVNQTFPVTTFATVTTVNIVTTVTTFNNVTTVTTVTTSTTVTTVFTVTNVTAITTIVVKYQMLLDQRTDRRTTRLQELLRPAKN